MHRNIFGRSLCGLVGRLYSMQYSAAIGCALFAIRQLPYFFFNEERKETNNITIEAETFEYGWSTEGV